VPQQTPPPGQAPPKPVDPASLKTVRRKLPNGMLLIVVHRPGSQLTALDLRVKVGSGDENSASNGTAHAVEHLVFKGTETTQPYDTDREMEGLGGELAARTTRDWTQYNVVVPMASALPALKVIAGMLQKPAFRQNDLDAERAVIKAEMAVTLSEPARAGFGMVAEKVFAGDEGYTLPLMGTATNVARLTPDDLRTFWQSWYRPQNMILTVVGDVNVDEIAKEAGILFTAPAGEARSGVSAVNPVAGLEGVVHVPLLPAKEQPDRTLRTVLVGFRAPGVAEDVESLPALDVLMYILGTKEGGGVGKAGRGLLYEGLVEKEWAQAVQADYVPGRRASLILLSATVTPRYAATFDERMMNEVRRIREDLLTDEIVASAREVVAAQVRSGDDLPDSFARRLGRMEALGLAPALVDGYADRVQSVTTDDVKKALARYLTPLRCVVAVLGEPATPDENASKANDAVTAAGGAK
jgi:zinc protease